MASTEFNDSEFVYGFVHDYLDDNLKGESLKKFQSLAEGKFKNLAERFQEQRGVIQTMTRELYMPVDIENELRASIVDQSQETRHEEVEIEQLTRQESLISTLRYVALVALIAAIILGAVFYFMPRQKADFASLDYLVYESLALQEDTEGTRLNLPTADWVEVRNYLLNYPGLNFTPAVLMPFSNEWEPIGATIIDYDTTKVAAVKFVHKNSGRQLYHFSYPGTLAALPKVQETGNLEGLVYQTYTTEKFNIVAWQQSKDVVSVFVSTLAAPEMAQLAKKGTAVN